MATRLQPTKEEWFKALLSGKYRRGPHCLRQPRGWIVEDEPTEEFCCLGVLLEISGIQPEDYRELPRKDELPTWWPKDDTNQAAQRMGMITVLNDEGESCDDPWWDQHFVDRLNAILQDHLS